MSSCAPNMVQFQLLFQELRHFESVSQTEPVFKLNLALSEKSATDECRSDSGIFYRVIVVTSHVATFVPRWDHFEICANTAIHRSFIGVLTITDSE